MPRYLCSGEMSAGYRRPVADMEWPMSEVSGKRTLTRDCVNGLQWVDFGSWRLAQ
jgi:hypothetical protein